MLAHAALSSIPSSKVKLINISSLTNRLIQPEKHIRLFHLHIMSSRHTLPFDYVRVQPFPDKTIYEPASIARSTSENNQVKIINYRGTKLTSFHVDGRQLICLPQAFDFFLKHLVGGLHTVYTKLKRLEILPIICNVEQVRVLRSLGAIQPGVNRCKLLAPNEFDILYDDCTNSSSRPGRPAKRTSSSSSHQLDTQSEKQRLKFASNLLLRSFSHLNYPMQSNINAFTQTTRRIPTNLNESRSFTIDAMLNHTRGDRLTKPIDLSMINREQTSANISVAPFHMKTMIELTVERARAREQQLEHEIMNLKNEITKEQDCREKLEQDSLQLRRIRNILTKKLKRLNRSTRCASGQKKFSDPSTTHPIPIQST